MCFLFYIYAFQGGSYLLIILRYSNLHHKHLVELKTLILNRYVTFVLNKIIFSIRPKRRNMPQQLLENGRGKKGYKEGGRAN